MKTKPIFILLLCVVGILLAMPIVLTPSHAQLGQVVGSRPGVTRQVTVRVQPPLQLVRRKTPPDLPPDDDEEEIRPRMDPPADPSVRPESIRPTSSESVVRVIPELLSETPRRRPAAPQAPGTFAFFRGTNTALASAPCVGGSPPSCMGGVILNRFVPTEPSVASNGRVVFYSTNHYAAVSGDSGQTFTYINPYAADGTPNQIDGGYGGDQVIYYERTRGLMFWLTQYFPDNNTSNSTNRQRLAFARSQDDVLNNNWSYLDLTPATFGFTTPPPGANGFWMDFPDLSVSDNFVYLTTNVFPRVSPNTGCVSTCPGTPCPAACSDSMGKPTCTGTCGAVAAVVARMPLDGFAQGQVNVTYYTDSHSSFRLTHGAHGTMYWGSHILNTQLRIYSWPENGNVSLFDVNHAAYNLPTPCTPPNVPPACGIYVATSPDGNNFAATADSRILGAWVANGVIGFMWDAAQGVNFPYPHVQVLRFNQSDGHLLTQGQVFSNTTAFLYPSVHPNDRGHLGGTMAWGGGSSYPNALAWIADDFNSGTITPLENVTFAAGNAGPSYNRWGDYLTTRVNLPYSNTWVGTGFVVQGSGGTTREPHYLWFGRERDTPPPTNTIYVDLANTSRYEDGSATHPYNTVAKGHLAAQPGDTIIIRAGTYVETVKLNTQTTVNSEGGTATIRNP